MAQPSSRYTNVVHTSPIPIGSICKIRADLLDRLARVIVSLGDATIWLTSIDDDNDAIQFESARFEVERLRENRDSIRVELECHRAQHGC
jgi:hypothetical protein